MDRTDLTQLEFRQHSVDQIIPSMHVFRHRK